MDTYSQKGFSLLDLLVAISISSVVASIAIPSISDVVGQMQASQDLRKLSFMLSELRSEAIRTKMSVRVSFNATGYNWDLEDDGVIDGKTGLSSSSSWKSAIPSDIVFNGLGTARGIGSQMTIAIKNRNKELDCTINSNGYISL
jgi:prepilin-type N-terminal cleavage/methylation domain-containing protein